MIRVVLVDDEPLALKNLQNKLLTYEDIDIVQTFTSGTSFLENIQHIDFQVIFLDIEMPGIKGIELARILNERGTTCHIVFVTAHRDYAFEAFEVNSTDYLLKPFSTARLKMTIERIRNKLNLEVFQVPIQKSDECPLKIQCFGSFNVYFNNEVVLWRTEKMRELFAFLLQYQPSPVHTDILIEALWGNDDYQKARIKLHTMISYLRKAFSTLGYPKIIGSANKSYVLELVDYQCDAKDLVEFMESDTPIDDQSISRAEKIVDSYQGGYLQHNDYSWSTTRAQDLHNQLLLLCEKLIEYYTVVNQPVKKERLLITLLKLEPYEEAYIYQLLQHYDKTGNFSSAIDAYTQYENDLLNDLNIPPSKKIVQLYDELKQLMKNAT